ncbi:MAG: PAS domain S-box protein, partial [Candidatus Aenigmatarchaeota archaeon]
MSKSAKKFIETMSSLFYVFDENYKIVFINEAYANYFEINRDFYLGKDFLDLVPEEFHSKVSQDVHSLTIDNPEASYECRIVTFDGETRWQSWKFRAIYGEDNEFLNYYCIGKDITEEKNARAQLEVSQQKYRKFIDKIPIFFFSANDDLDVIFVNDSFCDYLGVNKQEYIGRNLRSLIPKDYSNKVLNSLFFISPSNVETDFEYKFVDDNGHINWHEWKCVGIPDQNGEISEYYCLGKDITKERLANELESSRDYLDITLNSIGDAIISTDVQGHIVRMNPIAENLIGYKFEEVKGNRLKDIFYIYNNLTRRPHEDLIEKTIRTKEIHCIEEHTVLCSKDGREYQISDSVSPIMDKHDRVVGVVIVFRDITEKYHQEIQIQKSKKLFQDTVESLDEALLQIDNDCVVKLANKASKNLLGEHFGSTELEGKTCHEIFYKTEQRCQFCEGQRDVDTHGFSVSSQTLSDGTVLQKSYYPILDVNGNQEGATILASDITDRKKAEDALQENKEKYRKLFDNSPDAIAIIDLEGRFIIANCAMAKRFGLTKEEIKEKTVYDLMDYDLAKERMEFAKKCLEANEIGFSEDEREGRYLNNYFIPLELPNKDNSFQIISRDITLQKKTEKELRTSQERFRFLIEKVSNIAIQGYNIDREVIFWNKASERLYKYTYEEAIGKKIEDLIIPKHMKEEVIQRHKDWIEKGIPIEAEELVLKDKYGKDVYVFSSHVIYVTSKNNKEMFCIDVDLNEQQKNKYELIKAKEQAEAANKAKSEFLANMSHEIRTPLNGMKGMLRMIGRTDLDEKQIKYLEMALSATDRLNRLLTDILDLSKIEANRMEIQEEKFKLFEIADCIKDIFAHVNRTNKNTLEVLIEEDVPNELLGDSTRLTQILFNVVGNACKYTKNGKINCNISRLYTKENTCRLLFIVEDTGKGISDDKIEKIFET